MVRHPCNKNPSRGPNLENYSTVYALDWRAFWLGGGVNYVITPRGYKRFRPSATTNPKPEKLNPERP